MYDEPAASRTSLQGLALTGCSNEDRMDCGVLQRAGRISRGHTGRFYFSGIEGTISSVNDLFKPLLAFSTVDGG